jgi:hypothetical protein
MHASSYLAASIFWQIERRTTDNFEYVGGGSLLLPRLAQFVGEPRDLCFAAGS